MGTKRQPERVSQTGPAKGVAKGTVALIGVGALVVGLVAGAIVGGIWEHRLGQSASAPPGPAVKSPPEPTGPTPAQKAALHARQTRVQKEPADVEGWIDLG